MKAIPETRRAH